MFFINSDLEKCYDYTELIQGESHWTSGSVNIVKQGRIVIANIALYSKNSMQAGSEYELLSYDTLNSIGCGVIQGGVRFSTSVPTLSPYKVPILVYIDNQRALAVLPGDVVHVNDNFRAQLIWITN